MAEKGYPCVVCAKWPMLPPIYQFQEGRVTRLICDPCRTQNLSLPRNKKLTQKMVRCEMAERLQPELTKCREKDCQELSANKEDMEEHVKSECNFTEISLCRIMELESSVQYLYCDTKSSYGRIHTAIDHFRNSHEAMGQLNQTAFDYRWTVCDEANQVRRGLWYIADDASVVFLQMIEKDKRRRLRVFLLGDRKAPLELHVVLEMIFTPKTASNGNATTKCLGSRFEMTLTTFKDDEADDFKNVYTFDAGSVLLPIWSFTIDVDKGKGSTGSKRTLPIDSEVPGTKPFGALLKDLKEKIEVAVDRVADKMCKAFRPE